MRYEVVDIKYEMLAINYEIDKLSFNLIFTILYPIPRTHDLIPTTYHLLPKNKDIILN